MGTAEIADLLGVTRQRVHQLTSRRDFPEPVVSLRLGKVWRTEDVVAWARARGREVKKI